MTYQFSFNEKNEIIIFNDRSFVSKIGALLEALIDINWNTVAEDIELNADDIFFAKQDGRDFIKEILEKDIQHQTYVEHLMQAQNRKELLVWLKDLSEIKEIVIKIFDLLVDEQRHLYSNLIFELLYIKAPEMLLYDFIKSENATLVPFKERNLPIYSDLEEFNYFFKTNEIRTIIFQEIQFLCNNDFILRKCLYCRKFFWTRKLNNTYCDRVNDRNEKECSKIGPSQRCLSKRTAAYTEYWNKRTRIFNRYRNKKDRAVYLSWLNLTAPYKELAKKDEISLDEMKRILEKIETDIYSGLA